MRTTITFENDVAAAIDEVRRQRHVGVSAAVNELVRRGLAAGDPSGRFVQATSAGRARVDVGNVAEVLDLLDGAAAR